MDRRLLRVGLQDVPLLHSLALFSSEGSVLGLSLDEQADPWMLRGHNKAARRGQLSLGMIQLRILFQSSEHSSQLRKTSSLFFAT